MLTHIDLFSGIGGFSLATEWAGFKTICFCEKNEYCQKVLKKWWPEVPIVSEIRDFHWSIADSRCVRQAKSKKQAMGTEQLFEGERITLITGGFPCQPFSVAGKRRGKEDDRYLWPEMFRVISEVRPTWILAENVAGIVNLELDNCLFDLESEGYKTEKFIIPACAVNAPHRRNRVWVVGYSRSQKRNRISNIREEKIFKIGRTSQGMAYANPERLQKGYKPKKRSAARFGEIIKNYWAVEPNVGRVAHGIPNRVDRLKCLGNAIVPQVAYEILKCIAILEKGD